MDWHNIEQLIEKYYNGETSVGEEQLLQQAFCRNDIPAHLQDEQLMFSTFNEEQTTEYTSVVNWETINNKPTKLAWLYPAAGLVASLLLVVTAVRIIQPNETENTIAYLYINGEPVQDEELAKAKTLEALQLVSTKMNTNTKHIKEVKKLEKPFEILNIE